MIRTQLNYGGGEFYINPQTISYIIRDRTNEVTIGFTNGHTYTVTASIPELLEVFNNETERISK